jgi:hypothetical protein
MCLTKPAEISDLISYIFKKINEVVESDHLESVFVLKKDKFYGDSNSSVKRGLEQLCYYKKMLSGLVNNSSGGLRGTSNKSNLPSKQNSGEASTNHSSSSTDDGKRKMCQRMIISNLISSKRLVKVFEFRYFCEIKALITINSGNNSLGSSCLYSLVDFYCSYLTLLAELSQDFSFGIIQARRLLTLEQLVDILTSSSTPFIIKKHFLKCFHHIFVDSVGVGLNGNENLIEEILNLVINHDLNLFSLYIDHVITSKDPSA